MYYILWAGHWSNVQIKCSKLKVYQSLQIPPTNSSVEEAAALVCGPFNQTIVGGPGGRIPIDLMLMAYPEDTPSSL